MHPCYHACHPLNDHDNHKFATHHLSFTSQSINQMCTFHESMLLVNAQAGRDEPRTPRHKPHHDLPDRRQLSSSGKPSHQSHLRSPSRQGNASFTGHHSSPLPTPIHTTPHHRLPSNLLYSLAQAQEVHQPAPYGSDEKHATCSNARLTSSGMGPRPGVGRTTREGSFPHWVKSSASIGTLGMDALPKVTKTDMNVLAAGTRITALRSVLELRKN